MASPPSRTLALALIIFFCCSPFLVHAQEEAASGVCASDPAAAAQDECHSVPRALRLKLIAIPTILFSSVVGVCLPLFARSMPALQPNRSLFSVVKAFASGVILATGYMHVLPDSFDSLSSPCLPVKPWHEFPFTTFVAMLAALFTLMVDSLMLTFYSQNKGGGGGVAGGSGRPSVAAVTESPEQGGHLHGHGHGGMALVKSGDAEAGQMQLHRNRVVVQVLEMGIVVHSVVIGLGMGASQSVCTIRPLVAAMCFHQLFEGMGLGGCILQAEYGSRMKSGLVFFFSTTTPFGIALGLALTKVYRDNSPTALIVVGLLNAVSAGRCCTTWPWWSSWPPSSCMGPKLQGSARLQLLCFLAVLLGAGGMSVLAKWA